MHSIKIISYLIPSRLLPYFIRKLIIAFSFLKQNSLNLANNAFIFLKYKHVKITHYPLFLIHCFHHYSHYMYLEMLLSIKYVCKVTEINMFWQSIYLRLFPCQLYVYCKLTFHSDNSDRADVELFGCRGDRNGRNTLAYLLIYGVTENLLKHCHGNA
jgi:hypothetical protein